MQINRIWRHSVAALMLALSFLCIAWYGDIKPLHEKQHSLEIHNIELKKNIFTKSTHGTEEKENIDINKENILSDIIKFTEEHALLVSSLQTKNSIEIFPAVFHVMLSGDMKQIAGFITYLASYPIFIGIKNFSISGKQDNDISLTTDIFVYPVKRFASSVYFNPDSIRNVFADRLHSMQFTDETKPFSNATRSVPLKELRYAGWIKESNQIWGLLRLQDNAIIIVRKGDTIGLENAQVTTINENNLIVNFNHSFYTLATN